MLMTITYCNFIEKRTRPIMKRKLIDLDAETERRLSILASSNGMSLKKYIEYILFNYGSDHIINMKKKPKRMGYNAGYTKSWKKAIVTLNADSKTIEFFDGMM